MALQLVDSFPGNPGIDIASRPATGVGGTIEVAAGTILTDGSGRVVSADSSTCVYFYGYDPASGDYSLEVPVSFDPTDGVKGANFFAILRGEATSGFPFYTGYMAGIGQDNNWKIWRNLDALGAAPVVAPTPKTFLMRFSVVGSTLTLSVDGVVVATATDSTYAGPGKIGLWGTGGGPNSNPLFGSLSIDDGSGGGTQPIPTLTLSPSSATAGNGVGSVSLTAILASASGTITASVDPSQAGTFSTSSPTSGTPFAFIKNAGFTGTATVTVTTGSLSAYSTINVVADGASNPLSLGALSLTANDPSGVTITRPDATGGNGAKSYDLHRLPSPTTVPSDATKVGSMPSASLKDMAPGTDAAFYRVAVTDQSGTAVSRQSAGVAGLVVLPVTGTERIGTLGDSLTYGSSASSPPANYPNRLRARRLQRYPGRACVVTNLGQSGTTTANWVSMLSSVVANLQAAGVTEAELMLGMNDANSNIPGGPTSTGTFISNLTTIRNGINGGGIKLTIYGPSPCFNPDPALGWSDAANARLLAYIAAMPALATENCRVFPDAAYRLFASQPSLIGPDGVHWTDAGYDAFAAVVDGNLDLAPSGGGSGPTASEIAAAVLAATIDGESVAKILRLVRAEALGAVDLATVPGTAIYKRADGSEAFRGVLGTNTTGRHGIAVAGGN